ncbi:MAG: hypothetical protein J6T24_03555, partial [Clostridia bacterium]|nr:hypothetical protein [Clostridia bacterium]
FDNLASRNLTGTGNTSGTASTIYDILQNSVESKTNVFSSFWDSEVTAKNNELQRVIGIFNSK